MRRCRPDPRSLALLVVLMLGVVVPAAAQGPAVGSWATYEWRSAAKVDVPVVVQQPSTSGAASWSVDQETVAPRPIFETFSVVRGDAKTYVLQIVTRPTPEGKPLSVTQVTVDRASGKVLKSVIRDKKGGVIATPESGFRPLRQADVQGPREEVAVPAGRFTAVKGPHRNGTVWVSDQVPVLGIVKGVFPDGQLELVKSGTGGAQDMLRS